MGLDMYLYGSKFFWTDWKTPADNRTEDGIEIRDLSVNLGYWRKHPNLHGYIVKTFADGLDECQEIPLDVEQLKTIVGAVKEKRLPPTTGFFFGASTLDDAEIADDVKQLERAIVWLETKEPRVSRSVVYHASW
jgi:hypothetical protein